MALPFPSGTKSDFYIIGREDSPGRYRMFSSFTDPIDASGDLSDRMVNDLFLIYEEVTSNFK